MDVSIPLQGSNGVSITSATEPNMQISPSLGAGTSIKYDTAQAAIGVTSAKIGHSSTSTVFMTFGFDGSTGGSAFNDVWVEIFVNLGAGNPTGKLALARFFNGATELAFVRVGTTGKLTLETPAGGSTLYTSTNSLTLNAWNRVALHVNSASQQIDGKLFLGANFNGTTADESSGVKTSVSIPTGGTATVELGVTGATNPGIDYWIGGVKTSTSAYPGPATLNTSSAHLLALTGVGS